MTTDNLGRSQECPFASSQLDRREFLKAAAAIPAALTTAATLAADARSRQGEVRRRHADAPHLVGQVFDLAAHRRLSRHRRRVAHVALPGQGDARLLHARTGRQDVPPLRGGRHQHLARARTRHPVGDLQPPSAVGRKDVPAGTHGGRTKTSDSSPRSTG